MMADANELTPAEWHLLADATTDYIATWEGIDYALDLLHSTEPDRAVAALERLLNAGLIEFMSEEPHVENEALGQLLPLTLADARQRLRDPQFHDPTRGPNEERLWYAATQNAKERLAALTESDSRAIFGSTNQF